MIPKLSAPLTKAIRTLEGILLSAAAAMPWLISLLDPHTLSKADASKWSVISAGILAVSRTVIKVVGGSQAVTGVAPAPIDLEAIATHVAAKVGVAPTTEEIRAVVSDAVKAVQAPSVPVAVEDVLAGT